jgi:hypothetical protein
MEMDGLQTHLLVAAAAAVVRCRVAVRLALLKVSWKWTALQMQIISWQQQPPQQQ